MARAIDPGAAPGTAPRDPGETAAMDALLELIGALHASGTLRLLGALAERGPEAAGPLLEVLDTPRGRIALTNLARVGEGLTALDPAVLERLAGAAAAGAREAETRLAEPPPSAWTLLNRFYDPDVRRGLGAALAFLGGFGRALAKTGDGSGG